VAVVAGIRTPFCKMGTSFNDMDAQALGRVVTRELIERSGAAPEEIDEVIFGNVSQPVDAANIARVIALQSGVPATVPSYTVHRNCASGIEAVVQAAMKIRLGDGNCYIAGGTESMSNIPFYFTKPLQEVITRINRAKTFGQKIQALAKFKLKYLSPRVGLEMGLTDPVSGLIMGLTAEVLAREFDITREEQDRFALESHLKAVKAKALLKEEIVPVICEPKYKTIVDADNGPREGQTLEALEKLKPYFDRKSGTVTVGNSSQVTDGAAALLLMDAARANELNYQPLGYIRAYAFAGVEPQRMGIGPAHAIPKVLKKAGMALKDIQAIEINEAFAAQVLACLRALDSKKFAEEFGYEGYTGRVDPAILNVNGGAIALGHPVGATGARLILTMLKHMNRSNLNTGLVSLCVGGGQGAAVVVEKQ
jgi:acetyl-CoA acetyltransferase family protein